MKITSIIGEAPNFNECDTKKKGLGLDDVVFSLVSQNVCPSGRNYHEVVFSVKGVRR